MTTPGRFIVFEGVEGCGKTTQINRLKHYLKSRQRAVLTTKEPGGTVVGKGLRKLLLNSRYEMTPLAELMLYEADRAIHIDKLIKPCLAEGKIVLCDRFSDSTVAYQGYGRGIDLGIIDRLSSTLGNDLVPDLTIVLDIDPKTGIGRSLERQAELDEAAREDKFEKETLDFHGRVREGFLRLAAADPSRHHIVAADGLSIEEVFDRIAPRIESLLGAS